MNNPGLIKSFLAGAVIAPYRAVKFGADDDHVVQSAAATDAHIGVSGAIGATAAEDRIDITLDDIAEIEYGGTVTRGDLLTADANGMAVTAAPAAGVNNRIIGQAMVSGVFGDIGSLDITKTSIQG